MEYLVRQVESLCQSSNNNISMLANVSSLLNEEIKDINWVGFYLIDRGELILGPFQGKVACTKIEIGKGVCGTAYQKKMLLNINDVHQFQGYIACDSSSNSEIVIPLIYLGNCYGVLDIDSKTYSRFTYDDEVVLEKVAETIAKYINNNLKQ